MNETQPNVKYIEKNYTLYLFEVRCRRRKNRIEIQPWADKRKPILVRFVNLFTYIWPSKRMGNNKQ